MNLYYIFQDEAQKGPFTISQLRAMWGSGALTVNTLHCEEGSEEWRPLSNLLRVLEPPAASTLTPQFQPQFTPIRSNFAEEIELWRGQPSHWNYFWAWVVSLLLVALFGLGLLLIACLFIARARRVYIITNRKVMIQSGLVIKSTNEIRIKDIQSINVTKTGLAGWMGIGRVEFSSAATDRAEVIFAGIPSADKVRDIVRRAQDEN